ncbi:MAG: hypothetical protein ACD_79C00569G0003 [uncultured bacterium]|nr:MAG: hypothetical protein ACD_79C00569G0003 [uncultured bacterium]
MKDSNILTTSEVAEYFQLNKSTVYFLAKTGKMPAFKVGKQWRFNKKHLETWMQSHSLDSNNPLQIKI